MKCSKCNQEFLENELDLSHDVPRYIGGTDKDGRHYLCKKCHDIYERLVMNAMVMNIPQEIVIHMRKKAKEFSNRYFKSKGESNGNT